MHSQRSGTLPPCVQLSTIKMQDGQQPPASCILPPTGCNLPRSRCIPRVAGHARACRATGVGPRPRVHQQHVQQQPPQQLCSSPPAGAAARASPEEAANSSAPPAPAPPAPPARSAGRGGLLQPRMETVLCGGTTPRANCTNRKARRGASVLVGLGDRAALPQIQPNRQSGYRVVRKLSLIHISEPTRPY